jgi:hypothetical protein
MGTLMNRRTKMVSIRLMEDEYRRLKDLCEARGARSVSDLAREALFRLLPGNGAQLAPDDLEDRVRELSQTVVRLDEQMRAMESRLAAAVAAAISRRSTWAG